MTFDLAHWQTRLDQLRADHQVPGATLAVLVDGRIHELASGVLHRGTGVTATADSLFQLGSVAKVYTATLVMRLVEAGKLDLDARVIDVLPGFTVADPVAAGTVTVRQLLNHTSGLSGDFSLDTGRGDDALAGYVAACADLGQDFPPGAAFAYSSSGYNVLGRIIEVITGLTWDEALRTLLLEPLGLTHSVTLPEQALRFRTAIGHEGPQGEAPTPVPVWNLMTRNAGPYGGALCSSAADLVRFAQLHLNDGRTPDGTRLLSTATVTAMQNREVEVPDKWTVSSDAWGLGWTLYDWDGTPGYGHDGAGTGQFAYLRVIPGTRVAVALLTNGGDARILYANLFRELLAEIAEVRMPAPFGPPARPLVVDVARFAGTYRREGVEITVTARDGVARLVYRFVGGMAVYSDALEMELTAVSESAGVSVFAGPGTGTFSGDWMPVVFSRLPDGTGCVYVGARATPKIA
ncbi:MULTISPECIES: serine hydrolase [unclassified Crossiella]|uniref:serine hydrolase domain-containing protein n=1 Tax=unclassified Crossiella TaxID=2620835 RepID=UPI001FFF1886|nr:MULTISPECIES: serine hydrolase domain-containing protein [unclassified Crossiella]MCK2240182.1 beta-lactamase family protein [Crossiella sp. S99.2]MCK2253366.1 beta-lactamase family protein [Crossiella sp. S99.1]